MAAGRVRGLGPLGRAVAVLAVDRRELELDEHHVIAEAHGEVEGSLAGEEINNLKIEKKKGC